MIETTWYEIFVQFLSGRRRRWRNACNVVYLGNRMHFKDINGHIVKIPFEHIEYHTIKETDRTVTFNWLWSLQKGVHHETDDD